MFLETGSDSPVSEASIVLKFFDWMILPSAGILSPSSSIKTSPGTSWGVSTVISFPLRSTLAVLTIIFRKEAIALSARYSCENPILALINTTAIITHVSSI